MKKFDWHKLSETFYSVKEWVIKNKFLVILFLVSTSFFIWQHYSNLSWDFSSFVMNAKYWAGAGNYYVTLWPPLMPFIILILSPFTWAASEYLFITIVSALFMFSTIKLSAALKVNKELFYLLSLSPYAFYYSFLNGTELLSLMLLNLFVSSLLTKKIYSGIYLGLACLARYNFFIFAPLLVFSKNAKFIPVAVLLFLFTLTPWFVYNYFNSGNFFTSMADSYAQNVKYRAIYSPQPVNFLQLFDVVSFLAPIFTLGVFLTLKNWKKYFPKKIRLLRFFSAQKASLIIFGIMILSIFQYSQIPNKDERYLFPVILPASYFSLLGLMELKKRSQTFYEFSVCILVLLIAGFVMIIVPSYFNIKDRYIYSVNLLDSLKIQNCRTLSNAWAFLDYFGKTTEVYPRKEVLRNSLDSGNYVLFFYSTPEPTYVFNKTFLGEFSNYRIFENDQFILFGNTSKCNPERKVDQPFIKSLNESIFDAYNYSINTNPCFYLFDGRDFLEKSCNLINGKGFNLDTYRAWQ